MHLRLLNLKSEHGALAAREQRFSFLVWHVGASSGQVSKFAKRAGSIIDLDTKFGVVFYPIFGVYYTLDVLVNCTYLRNGENNMKPSAGAQQEGINAAEEWLALVDAGDFEESWEHTSSHFKSDIFEKDFFRSGISKHQWQSSLRTLQDSLGRALLRRLKSKRYTTKLPWEPPAEYVVLEYDTTFALQMKRTESVILIKESDGEWRVSEYKFKIGTSNTSLDRSAG